MSNILVYGWSGHNNLGDELFKDAFQKLFQKHSFTFTDHITQASFNNHYDAVFIGGGSFLDTEPQIDRAALGILHALPVFYIGVGVETELHPVHVELMRKARLVATRTRAHEKVKALNANTFYIPDIVYCLEPSKSVKRIDKSVLYLPNIYTVPKSNDAYWTHVSWEHFKLEFSQVLDHILGDGFKVDIFAMCKSKFADDSWAGVEVSNKMERRRNRMIAMPKNTTDLFAQYSLVITQRYHGIILAEMAKTPYVSIYHHDKLKASHFNAGSFVSYYEMSKDRMLKEIYAANANCYDGMPIVGDMFMELQHRVEAELNG